MPIGIIMGRKSLLLIDWSSRCWPTRKQKGINSFVCAVSPSLSLKRRKPRSRTMNPHRLPIIPFGIVAYGFVGQPFLKRLYQVLSLTNESAFFSFAMFCFSLNKTRAGRTSCLTKVGSAKVSPVSAVRNLGSWFDSQLTMSSHISKLCSVGFYYLCNIRHVRKYLSQETAGTLLHAFITSGFDYCNSLLYGLPNRWTSLRKFREFWMLLPGWYVMRPRFASVAYQGTHPLQGTSPHV